MVLNHPGQEYIDGVLNDSIPACQSIRRAVERSVRDQEEKIWEFDAKAANLICLYSTLCKHSKGKWAGSPFVLEPWEKFILGEIFGWKSPETGLRRYRIAYVEIPKKNGKSTLLSVVGVYMLHADGEEGAEVYSLASQRDQARIVFDESRRMVRASPDLREDIEVLAHNMHVQATNSKYEPLASDVDTVDGKNPSCNIVDELHAHKSRYLWDLLENSTSARQQPLTITITTAGHDITSVCYEQHTYALNVLDRIYQNDRYFAYVATPDEGDDWRDEHVWAKVNPNLNVTIPIESMRDRVKKAEGTPGLQNAFRRYQLDEWVEAADRWMSIDDWDRCIQGETDDIVCWGGLDLALAMDMTAVVYLFDDGVNWYVKPRFYVPEETIIRRTRDDKLPYDIWAQEGHLITTPGNVTDTTWIKNDILADAERLNIQSFGYDPYKATALATELLDEGIPMVEVRQGAQSLNEPMLRLEAKVLQRRVAHNRHPILSWNARNIVARQNPNGDIAPDRGKSTEKIDGMVALIIAINRRLDVTAAQKESIYATQSPLIIAG